MRYTPPQNITREKRLVLPSSIFFHPQQSRATFIRPPSIVLSFVWEDSVMVPQKTSHWTENRAFFYFYLFISTASSHHSPLTTLFPDQIHKTIIVLYVKTLRNKRNELNVKWKIYHLK